MRIELKYYLTPEGVDFLMEGPGSTRTHAFKVLRLAFLAGNKGISVRDIAGVLGATKSRLALEKLVSQRYLTPHLEEATGGFYESSIGPSDNVPVVWRPRSQWG